MFEEEVVDLKRCFPLLVGTVFEVDCLGVVHYSAEVRTSVSPRLSCVGIPVRTGMTFLGCGVEIGVVTVGMGGCMMNERNGW